MKKILIATTNQAKIDEYRKFLEDIDIEVVDLKSEGITQKAVESGKTLTENALIKAQFYQSLTGLPTIADDGGFEIDALGGAPGVSSHRITDEGKENSDDEIINYIIEKMKTVPSTQRGAQMRLVIAFMLPSKEVFTAEAVDRGVVGIVPSQTRIPGFPYRSLLYFPEVKKYYGELTGEEMNTYNHRRRALEQLKPKIIKFLS